MFILRAIAARPAETVVNRFDDAWMAGCGPGYPDPTSRVLLVHPLPAEVVAGCAAGFRARPVLLRK